MQPHPGTKIFISVEICHTTRRLFLMTQIYALEQQGLNNHLNALIDARKGIDFIDYYDNDMLEIMIQCVACD